MNQTHPTYRKLAKETVQQLRQALDEFDLKAFVEKADSDENGTFRVVASKQTPDRDGDELPLDGWSLDNFRENPVLLWAHDHKHELPIGVVTKIDVEGDELVAEGVFAPSDVNPLAQKVRRAYDMGIVNAVSVGFMPLEFDKDFNVIKQELVELSFVPVPMHPEALRKELRAHGLEEKEIDELGVVLKAAETPQEAPGDAQEAQPDADPADGEKTPEKAAEEPTAPEKTDDAAAEPTDPPAKAAEPQTTKNNAATLEQMDALLSEKFEPINDKLTAIEGRSEGTIPRAGDTKGRNLPTDGTTDIRAFVRTAQDIDKAAEYLIREAKKALNQGSAT
jgi:hypothetical protein